MNRYATAILLAIAMTCTFAADIPPAPDALRAQYIQDYAPACIKGIEDKPDMKVQYSHRTVEVYCNCRQRARADVAAQAMKNNERGAAVADRAAEYAQAKCTSILVKGLERE